MFSRKPVRITCPVSFQRVRSCFLRDEFCKRRINPDRNERRLPVVVQRHPDPVQARACREVPGSVCRRAHSPAPVARHTYPHRAGKALARLQIKLSGGDRYRDVSDSHSLGSCVFRESEQEFRSASCYARQSRSSRWLVLPGGSGSCALISIYTCRVAPTLPLVGRCKTLIP
jgi:hypothetical protein